MSFFFLFFFSSIILWGCERFHLEVGLISEALALPLRIPGDLAAHACGVSAGWWAATGGDGGAILNVLPAAE